MGSFICYYIVLHDFGFEADSLFGMSNFNGIPSNDKDVYDPTDPFLGNMALR